MAKQTTAPKGNKQPAAKAATPFTGLGATPATTAPADQPKPVALRGGAAVAQVRCTGKNYRTAAAHNKQWWDTITAAQTAAGKAEDGQGNPVPVAGLLVSETNKNGVPAHFVGYALRRGYLQEVK